MICWLRDAVQLVQHALDFVVVAPVELAQFDPCGAHEGTKAFVHLAIDVKAAGVLDALHTGPRVAPAKKRRAVRQKKG